MIDKKLLSILVCPKCKGSLLIVNNGAGLSCKPCQLLYPVRDNVPVMLVDEAVDLRSGQTGGVSANMPVASFVIISGPNKGLTFHVERSTCKAIGRALSDQNRTAMFNVDISLSLDEGTKALVQKYISRQFKKKAVKGQTGNFKRTSDVILDDVSVSRFHAMLFHDETGIGILDMVSKNGTFVNGEEVESRLLKRGDTIEVGDTKIVLEG